MHDLSRDTPQLPNPYEPLPTRTTRGSGQTNKTVPWPSSSMCWPMSLLQRTLTPRKQPKSPWMPAQYGNATSKPPARIERWALRLQPYQTTVHYRKGEENPADYIPIRLDTPLITPNHTAGKKKLRTNTSTMLPRHEHLVHSPSA